MAFSLTRDMEMFKEIFGYSLKQETCQDWRIILCLLNGLVSRATMRKTEVFNVTGPLHETPCLIVGAQHAAPTHMLKTYL